MEHFLSYQAPTGPVLIEITVGKPTSGELVGKAASGRELTTALITEAKQKFDGALDIVQQSAAAFLGQVNRMVDRPSQVEVTFGLKAVGEAGIFAITKLGGEANFTVKLSWTRTGSTTGPAAANDNKGTATAGNQGNA
jgi:NTP-dependent ternary system trypsin peptidase co-occuring protein